MKTYEATETAYKNGYKKGYEDGKKDAVKQGHWENHMSKIYGRKVANGFTASCCGRWNSVKTAYCPNCGAKMDGEGIEVGKN